MINSTLPHPAWLTIREAVKIINKITDSKINSGDILRYALCRKLPLSIYFQSPIILKKIKKTPNKSKLRPVGNSIIHQLCLLEKNCFLNGRNLIISTEDQQTYSKQSIIDTSLSGHEYFLIQLLLAHSLKIPLPEQYDTPPNYGITVSLSGELFLLVKRMTWKDRINQQLSALPDNISKCIERQIINNKAKKYIGEEYFPVYDLPQSACFVIRYTELEKLINLPSEDKSQGFSSTRISTPLSRLFWLACKNNESISPLINQPYKLLSIFEQWASVENITDRLSGETLKNALKRGSPSSSSSKN